MRKGQAAMEFLMTYGWAILVVLAAIGALAYFGVLSPDRFLPPKCTITGGFSCTEYRIDATGPIVKIQNNLGVDSTVTNVNIEVKTESFESVGGASCGANIIFATSTVVNNGDYVFIGKTADAATNRVAFTTDTCTLLTGKFRGTITVDYVKLGESVAHQASGDISGNVEG
ncbi:MAG: hypothetical protein ABIA93_00520 [Candidatus Woesearchaeota archaeon]